MPGGLNIKAAIFCAATLLAGCAGSFETDYQAGVDPSESVTWTVTNVVATVPDEATTTERNSFAPEADIVWHGEELGDRKAQVSAIIAEGIRQGAASLNGNRDVTISATVRHFHAVTPMAVARAPAAVHNISYVMQVFDNASGQPLTDPIDIDADFEALVGAAAVTSAIQGRGQKERIIAHVAAVTRGVLGIGPDPRRAFRGLGR